MFNICSIYVQYMFNICSIYVQYMFIWKFPEIGLPPNHPFMDEINHPAMGGSPMTMETSMWFLGASFVHSWVSPS